MMRLFFIILPFFHFKGKMLKKAGDETGKLERKVKRGEIDPGS